MGNINDNVNAEEMPKETLPDYEQLEDFEDGLSRKNIFEIVRILKIYAQNDEPLPSEYVHKLVDYFERMEKLGRPGPKSNKKEKVYRDIEICKTYLTLRDLLLKGTPGNNTGIEYVKDVVNCDIQKLNHYHPYKEFGIIPRQKYIRQYQNEPLFAKKPTIGNIKLFLQKRVGRSKNIIKDAISDWEETIREGEKWQDEM